MGRIDTCARLCIGLSIPAIIFLCIIGYMFAAQPLYTSVEVEDPDQASFQCYIAALLYAISIVISLGAIWYEKQGSGMLATTREEIHHGDEGAELLGTSDPGYGSLTHLSQMPLMPQGYSRSDDYHS